MWLFYTKIRFPKNRPLIEIIRKRYGQEGVELFKSCEKCDLKCRKIKCDVEFLETCEINNLSPKLLYFRLYSRNFENNGAYRKFQRKLLTQEIQCKRELGGVNDSKCLTLFEDLSNRCSIFDYRYLCHFINKTNGKKIKKVKEKHGRKLFSLGLRRNYSKLPVDKVIFNLSSKKLSTEQKEALSLGLDFAFDPTKICYKRFFAAFEKVKYKLSQLEILNRHPDSVNCFTAKLKTIAFHHFHSFRPKISDHYKKLKSTLLELSKDKSIVVTKPDKGRRVVLLNRTDYVEKMYEILNNKDNFVPVQEDLYPTLLKHQDRNNRLADFLKKEKIVEEATCKELKCSGAQPGIMYGLPKIHKDGTPLRPILSSVGTFNYAMSKWLVSKLSVLTCNDYTIGDSFSFAREIKDFKNNGYVMASFDIQSLFTNIPLVETRNIILNKLFPTPNSQYQGFNRECFSKVLNNCTKNNIFLFDGKVFEQRDGAPMGGCVSPTLANAFLCFHENIWLSDCPENFKPILYRRYVDDTFLLFKHKSHIELFLNYLNNKHSRIKFTCEVEESSSLNFLDLKITKK